MDPAVTGLPAQLTRTPGPEAGLTPVHKRAAGEVHAMRRLATATPVGLIETSGGQEDVQSFAWEAADNSSPLCGMRVRSPRANCWPATRRWPFPGVSRPRVARR